MKNEIKNPMERVISKEETYFYGDGGVSDCDDCNKPAPEKPGHTGTFICSHCGGEFSVNEQNYVDPENTVCNACYAKINNRFICSKCGYSCPCSFESAEEGVCKNCYVPPEPDNTESPKDDTTDTPSGGTTDVPTDNEGTEPPENEDQYGDGGTGFYCAECGEYCPCDMRCIDKDGREVCMFCYRNPPVKFECDHCHNKFPVTEKHCIGDENICNSCYESLPVCPICEERITESDKCSEDCDWCKNCAEGFSIKNLGEDSIEKGSTTTLIATVSTSNGTVELPVTWSTTTPDIISVDANGNVTGLSVGCGMVEAMVVDKGAIYKINVVLPSDKCNKWFISDKRLTSESIDVLINNGGCAIGRYLNNLSYYSRYTTGINKVEASLDTTAPYATNEHIGAEELELVKSKGIKIFSIYHDWNRNFNDIIKLARYEAYLAIKLALNAKQPEGTTIFFEIDEREEYIYSNGYLKIDREIYRNMISNYINALVEEFNDTELNVSRYEVGVIYTNTPYNLVRENERDIFSNVKDRIIIESGAPVIQNSGADFSSYIIGEIENLRIKPILDKTNTEKALWLPENITPVYETYSDECYSAPTSPIQKEYGFDSAGAISDDTVALINNYYSQNNKPEISFVGRYINMIRNRHTLDESDLSYVLPSGNKIKLYSIYQNTVPSEDIACYYTELQGEYDAMIALLLADRIGQPPNTPIYFAADFGFGNNTELYNSVISYFDAISNVFKKCRYNMKALRIGVYGTGTLCDKLKDHFGPSKYIYTFLPAAQDYEGYSDYLISKKWNILQGYHNIQGSYYDTNEASNEYDFGGWTI